MTVTGDVVGTGVGSGDGSIVEGGTAGDGVGLASGISKNVDDDGAGLAEVPGFGVTLLVGGLPDGESVETCCAPGSTVKLFGTGGPAGSAVVFTNEAGVGSTIASLVGAMGLVDGSKGLALREVSSTARFCSEMLPEREEDVNATVTLAAVPTKRSKRVIQQHTVLFRDGVGADLGGEMDGGVVGVGGAGGTT
jgi:hypothetical protein